MNLITGKTVYTYNNLNQLTGAENGGTLVTYTYDANGNLVSEHGGSRDKTYTYDAENRLVTATVSSGNSVTIESYTYDYEGNRVSKQVNEEAEVYYLNDTFDELTQVVLELKKSGDGSYGLIYQHQNNQSIHIKGGQRTLQAMPATMESHLFLSSILTNK